MTYIQVRIRKGPAFFPLRKREFTLWYPLVNIQKAIENGHLYWIFPLKMVIFHMSNRKNPGNTKYVFDGHWLMEIDGNC